MPQDIPELLNNATNIAGMTLNDLANSLNLSLPSNQTYAKGFVGQMLEKALGASANNLSQPDFMHLGVELKTIPINANNIPTECTYICVAPIPPTEPSWSESRVWRKMQKILWIPYQSHASIPLSKRIIGMPFLWEPDIIQQQQLQADWEELTELMLQGRYNQISASIGKYLHIRPKAANSKTLIKVYNENQEPILTVPKGFYLRRKCTQELIRNYYA